MYKQYIERYDGDPTAIAKDVIAFAVNSASEVKSLDGDPVNVMFDLSVSGDKDPRDAYFKRVDEVVTRTCNLGWSDLANAVIDQLKASLEYYAKAGNLISFSVTMWKGAVR